jgi:Fanconi anemia group M protein
MEFLKNINPRDYQIEIAKKCIEKNCLVVLPTGLGKTLIALMVCIERMKKVPGQKVVFLAPTKPLVEQHLIFFKKHLPELFAEMNLFTGKVKSNERKKIWQDSDIVFSTPQCIANDLKKELYSLEDVCLLIEDEAHRCIKNYDYNYIAQIYIKQSKNSRILGLTASPGSDYSKVKEICKNLFIEDVELKTRESKEIKPYLKELTFEKKIVNFPPEFMEIRELIKEIFNDYLENLRKRKLIFNNSSKTELILLQKRLMKRANFEKKDYSILLAIADCSQAIRMQHALELIETQTLKTFNDFMKDLFKQASEKNTRSLNSLIKRKEFNLAYIKANELLSKGIEHPKIEELINLIKEEKNKKDFKVIIFSQFRTTAAIISRELNKIEGIKSKVFIGQTKKESLGEQIGLNQKEQRRIIEEFSEGKINVLCATSIGEEGLDIPEVSLVVFYEPVPSAIRKIQRGGRTARLSPGKIIVLITKGTRDETFYYVSNAKEKKMHKIIDDIKQEMLNKEKTQEKQQTLL